MVMDTFDGEDQLKTDQVGVLLKSHVHFKATL
jgi:hypothetical protein